MNRREASDAVRRAVVDQAVYGDGFKSVTVESLRRLTYHIEDVVWDLLLRHESDVVRAIKDKV